MSLIIASALVMGLTACQSGSSTSTESTAAEPASAAVTEDNETDSTDTAVSATVLTLDGIAVIVNTECAVDDLSLEQISAIYSKDITNWSEVGGD